MNISYSRVSSYLRCPYGHFLGYELGLGSTKPARPLVFGTDFHKLLELRNNPQELAEAFKKIEDTYYEMPARFQGELGENYLQDIRVIFEDYCTVYENAMQPSITEEQFELKVGEYKGEPIFFKGVIDELYKRKSKTDGKYMKIGEHKTFTRKPDHNTLVMNVQKNLYAKAVQILYGILPRSVIWDYIHSQPSAYPTWLEKTKRFSLAKSEKITPFSWGRACAERGITDPEVTAQGETYRGNIPNFFFRCEMDLVPQSIEQVWASFVYTARDIVKQGHKNQARNMNKDCQWCSYRDICFTQLTGGDLSHLLETAYTVTPRDDITKEERRVDIGILR